MLRSWLHSENANFAQAADVGVIPKTIYYYISSLVIPPDGATPSPQTTTQGLRTGRPLKATTSTPATSSRLFRFFPNPNTYVFGDCTKRMV